MNTGIERRHHPVARMMAAAGILAICSGPALAQCPDEPTAYVVTEGPDQLLSVDIATGTVNVIASLPATPGGIDINTTETTAYVTVGTDLLSVDLSTGATTQIATGFVSALDVKVNSTETTAYVVDTVGAQLYSVALPSGVMTTIAVIGSGYRGLAVDAYETVAYTGSAASLSLDSVSIPGGVTGTIGSLASTIEGVDLNGTEDLVYAATSSQLVTFAVPGPSSPSIVATGLSGAVGVDLNDSNTRALIAQTGSSELISIELPGGAATEIAAQVPGTPLDVAFGGSLACTAGCPNDFGIYLVDENFGPLGFLDKRTNQFTVLSASGLGLADGIAVTRDLKKAYVADRLADKLYEVDLLTGMESLVANVSGIWDVELNAAEDTLWISRDSLGLYTLPVSGGTLALIASMSFPTPSFEVDSTETFAYVANNVTDAIDVVDLIAKSVTPGSPGGYTFPRDLAISPDDTTLYVVDISAGRLYSAPASGGAGTLVASGFTGPVGVAVNSLGTLAFVTEPTLGRLTQVNLASGAKTVLSTSLGSPSVMQVESGPCEKATLFPTTQAPGTGSRIAVCLHLDMTFTPELLGSYSATLDWDPTILSYVNATGGDPPFDSPIVNSINAPSGSLTAADADPNGIDGVQHLLCTEFDVVGPTSSSDLIDLEFKSLYGAGTFNGLLPGLVAEDVTVDVQGLCVVGDVNDDARIDSGDALIVLSDEIGLSIPPAYQVLLAALCGDADGNAVTDSIDAGVILSHEVGLPVDPNFPVDAPLQTFDSCPACNAPPPAAPPLDPPLFEAMAISSPDALVMLNVRERMPKRDDLFEVVVTVDMTVGGSSLGSYGAALTWSPHAAEFVGVTRGPGQVFPAPLMNRGESAAGVLRFAQADPVGRGGVLELVRLRFRALHALPHPEEIFDLTISSFGSGGPSFRRLQPLIVEGSGAAAPRSE